MNVAAILKQKGRAVATIPPTLHAHRGRQADWRRGASARWWWSERQGEIAGIVSERDIIRALAEAGRPA